MIYYTLASMNQHLNQKIDSMNPNLNQQMDLMNKDINLIILRDSTSNSNSLKVS